MLKTFMILAFSLVAFSCSRADPQVSEQEIQKRIAHYKDSESRLKGELFALQDSLKVLEYQPPDVISKSELERLHRLGLQEPASQLLSDLQSRPDLIPIKTPPGSAPFRFSDINLLNDFWVLASIEDGHATLYMLLEFAVDASGEISWEVLGPPRQ